MASDVRTLKIVVDRWSFLEASRRQTGGDRDANPLRHALVDRTGYQLEEFSHDRLVLVFTRGQRFAGPIPRELADYMKRFKAGESIADAHTFDLTLVEI